MDMILDIDKLPVMVAGNKKSAMKQAGAVSADLWKVERSRIKRIEGFNVRDLDDPEYQAHIREIANSIKENGYYEDKPLAGFVAKEGNEDVIYLTDGYTRLAAIDLVTSEGVEIAPLPIIVKPRGTSMEDMTVALYTGNQGRRLTAMETAGVCKRLIGAGWTEKQVVDRLVMSLTQVKNLLDLIGAPMQIRKLVSQGKVAATLAVQTLHTHGSEAVAVLEKAVELATEQGKARATGKHVWALTANSEGKSTGRQNRTSTQKNKSWLMLRVRRFACLLLIARKHLKRPYQG